MYGGYLASKLYEFGWALPQSDRPRVLVLESGPFVIPEHFQNLTGMGDVFNLPARDLIDEPTQGRGDTFQKDGRTRLFVQHHRCVGGKSPFWGGWAPRLTAEDLDPRRWPEEVTQYLLQSGQPDGYEYVEKEIGTTKTTSSRRASSSTS
jgi:choline dehydrogenase-like flavoprotein